MAVDVVLDGAEARDSVELTVYDVLVLDRDLPGVHGDTLCRSLAASGTRTKILMLTAADALQDKVRGLGADDYLCKPFEFPELVARSGRWPAGPPPSYPRDCSVRASSWTRSANRPNATAVP